MNTKVCRTTIEPMTDRKMSFTISTGTKDRDNDTIDPKGWDLNAYRRNPVVLLGHKHDELPIAKTTAIWTTANGLYAEIEWPERGFYPFADTVHDLVDGGFLSATSVGFRPIQQRPNKDGGSDITQASLLERSIVAVPSNPETLVIQRGINKAAMVRWLGQSDDIIDWNAINRSSEINWLGINAHLSNRPEVDVTENDVRKVVAAMLPALKEGMRAGIKTQAQLAVEAVFCRMTGRLD